MSTVLTESQDNKEKFQQLKKKPLVAWPTVTLLAVAQATIISIWYLCLNEVLPLWVGCVINIVAYYALFTPAHDSMHKSVSKKGWVNDLVLWLTASTFIPGNSGKLLGLMHMQHHRFTNDALDPDHALVMNAKQALLLWFFWDFRYIYVYFQNKSAYPSYSNVKLWFELTLGLSLVVLLAIFFPIEVLLLWFIPTRVMVWLICLVFMYLPHVPHTHLQSEAPYQATLIREGWGWLLTPLMMYQNYHLVHHLYPTIPFYRYKKAWYAKLNFHESKSPAKVKAFRLHPYNLDVVDR